MFSRPNYRAWVNVKPVSDESRCVQCDEGGCLYVGGVIKRAAGVGTSRSYAALRGAYGRETASSDISKVKRELSKIQEAPVRAITLKRGNGDRFTCN